MCRKVELLDKRMMLGVVVTQIVPQMMQLKKFYHHQIEVNMPRVRLQDEGGRTVQRYVKDYRITQDMAKKLCKLHHTAVGAAYHLQPFDWDALLGLLHKKAPRRSSYEAQLSDA